MRLRTIHSLLSLARNSLLGQLEAQNLLVHGLQTPGTQDFANFKCTPENTPRGGFILLTFLE